MHVVRFKWQMRTTNRGWDNEGLWSKKKKKRYHTGLEFCSSTRPQTLLQYKKPHTAYWYTHTGTTRQTAHTHLSDMLLHNQGAREARLTFYRGWREKETVKRKEERHKYKRCSGHRLGENVNTRRRWYKKRNLETLGTGEKQSVHSRERI